MIKHFLAVQEERGPRKGSKCMKQGKGNLFSRKNAMKSQNAPKRRSNYIEDAVLHPSSHSTQSSSTTCDSTNEKETPKTQSSTADNCGQKQELKAEDEVKDVDETINDLQSKSSTTKGKARGERTNKIEASDINRNSLIPFNFNPGVTFPQIVNKPILPHLLSKMYSLGSSKNVDVSTTDMSSALLPALLGSLGPSYMNQAPGSSSLRSTTGLSSVWEQCRGMFDKGLKCTQ